MSLCSIRAYEVTCLCGLRSYVATLHGVAIRATCIYVSRTLYATYVMHEATVYEGGYFSNRCACIFICCRLLLYWLSVACLCLIQLQAGLTAQSAVSVFRLETRDVVERVSQLFEGRPHLLEKFKAFLPPVGNGRFGAQERGPAGVGRRGGGNGYRWLPWKAT